MTPKLTDTQRTALAYWWRYRRPGVGPAAGHYPHVLWERKATLLALERHGLCGQVTRHYLGGWKADPTPAGIALAEQLADEVPL